jgi:DNA-binding transcriptional LysR family regulator
MLRKIDWESQIGRRLPLRDLHVFTSVVQLGSMAKAAQRLGVSQPAVSEVIAGLEHALGVRLLDRRPRGVEATVYGAALMKRSLAAFDELKQSIRDIEFLSDPAAGTLLIGCPESISVGMLQPMLDRFSRQYPRVVIDVDTVNTFSFFEQLKERKLDVVLARGALPLENPRFLSELHVETVFDDELVVAVGRNNKWAKRRKVDIAELHCERWVLTSNDSWNYRVLAEAFRSRGLEMPEIAMRTLSVHIRANMIASGNLVTTFPASALLHYAGRAAIKVLPISLPTRAWPVLMVTLKERTLSPVVDRFMQCVRETAKSYNAKSSQSV